MSRGVNKLDWMKQWEKVLYFDETCGLIDILY